MYPGYLNCKELKQRTGVSHKLFSLLPFCQHSSIDFLPVSLQVLSLCSITSFNSIFGYELQLEIFLNKLQSKSKQKTIPTCRSSQTVWPCVYVVYTSYFLLCKKRKFIFIYFFYFPFVFVTANLYVMWVIRDQNPKNTMLLSQELGAQNEGKETLVLQILISVGSAGKALLDVRVT